MPLSQQSLLLLERLSVLYTQMKSAGGLHKGNLLLPNDPYGLAAGYGGAENADVRRHLLGAPWTLLVNQGYIVDPAGSGFYSISEDGYEAAKDPGLPADERERRFGMAVSQGRRTMPPKRAIAILKGLLTDSMILPGEPFASPKRSQWKDTARGALEQSGLSNSLMESFDQSQAMAFNLDSTDEEMRQMSNRNLASMTSVLNSAIEQLGWQVEEEKPAEEITQTDPPSYGTSRFSHKQSAIGNWHVEVDGETWEDARMYVEGRDLSVWGKSVPKVAKLSFGELLENFDKITVSLPDAKKDLQNWDFGYVEIDSSAKTKGGIDVAFRLEYDLEFWAKQYSISDLATAIEGALARRGGVFDYWQSDKNTTISGFGASVTLPIDSTVQQALSKQQELNEIVLLVRKEMGETSATSVKLVFDFPAPIKNACEQYLLYFVQFLSDLGIEASAEIKEQASTVLFSVTPVDERQALEKISEALRVYLGLPLAPDLAMAASQFNDVAVSQLQANVLHLQSQIMLAKAALEMKNATLDAKDAHIATLQERIDLRAFQPEPYADEAEELVKDVVSVKKWDYKFFEVNFPELLRRLKRKLK
jgi:hypothetical protein